VKLRESGSGLVRALPLSRARPRPRACHESKIHRVTRLGSSTTGAKRDALSLGDMEFGTRRSEGLSSVAIVSHAARSPVFWSDPKLAQPGGHRAQARTGMTEFYTRLYALKSERGP
jgi:hypothetical protein